MKLAKALNILEGDRRLILTLGVLHFLLAAAHSLLDIGATALLIRRLGPDTLPEVYTASALALIFVGLVIIPVIGYAAWHGYLETIDADQFKTASGDLQQSLRLICDHVHANDDVPVGPGHPPQMT